MRAVHVHKATEPPNASQTEPFQLLRPSALALALHIPYSLSDEGRTFGKEVRIYILLEEGKGQTRRRFDIGRDTFLLAPFANE